MNNNKQQTDAIIEHIQGLVGDRDYVRTDIDEIVVCELANDEVEDVIELKPLSLLEAHRYFGTFDGE